tara:strand:- start:4861 stop:5613 length:753 start_codon:yes stop_codon:yes gene_type:complete
MAMKFVKPMLVLALLSGCAAQQPKDSAPEEAKLVATQQFLPQQAYDAEGNKLPYEPEVNPYLEQTGTISKGSVLLFIEAKKARKRKDDETAEQKLEVITRQDPDLAGPYVMLGDIRMDNKDYKSAEENYLKAISINDENVNAYLGLGEAQRRLGKYKVAQNTYEKALTVWKDFPEAHLNLAVLYDVYLNLPTKAQAHYEAYLFLTGKQSGKADEWYQEVKSRTGIEKSFIDPGFSKPADDKAEKADDKSA